MERVSQVKEVHLMGLVIFLPTDDSLISILCNFIIVYINKCLLLLNYLLVTVVNIWFMKLKEKIIFIIKALNYLYYI